MQIIDAIAELREARKRIGKRVGLVPTMGALHEGHLSLVRQARAENKVVIVTIFVNPIQFEAGEDLNSYPRDLERDLEMLREAGADIVFTPAPEVMYPRGYQTHVTVDEVTKVLEGARRPGHFRGVATVVAKLFNLAQPDVAYFGQKDAQQVVVIRQMVRDLSFPLEVAPCPTVREPDGLAMSSRNAYLSPLQREVAAVLYEALQAAATAYDGGERDPEQLRWEMMSVLSAESLADPEYVSVADAKTLRELDAPIDAPLLLSMVVNVGRARLLDNCLLPFSLNTREGLAAALGGD